MKREWRSVNTSFFKELRNFLHNAQSYPVNYIGDHFIWAKVNNVVINSTMKTVNVRDSIIESEIL